MAITGNGQASKEQVADMLQRMLHFPKEDMPTFYGCNGRACCCLLSLSADGASHGGERLSWLERFIAKNPDKVKK